jgi:hypothetical protein
MGEGFNLDFVVDAFVPCRPLASDTTVASMFFMQVEGVVMSGWRPLIKGYFGVALVASAVMSSAFFCGE